MQNNISTKTDLETEKKPHGLKISGYSLKVVLKSYTSHYL